MQEGIELWLRVLDATVITTKIKRVQALAWTAVDSESQQVPVSRWQAGCIQAFSCKVAETQHNMPYTVYFSSYSQSLLSTVTGLWRGLTLLHQVLPGTLEPWQDARIKIGHLAAGRAVQSNHSSCHCRVPGLAGKHPRWPVKPESIFRDNPTEGLGLVKALQSTRPT